MEEDPQIPTRLNNQLGIIRTAGGAIRIFADSLWRDANSRPNTASAATNVAHATTTGPTA
jgi:hypothetical protein